MSSIAILTGSYNKRRYVVECIRSVQTQQDANWRHIVVDNSTDYITRELAFRASQDSPRTIFRTERFDVRQRQIRYPQAVIINQYFPEIDCDYVGWLSDDDLLLPNFCNEFCFFLDKYPAIQAAYCDYWVQVVDGDRILHQERIRHGGKIFGRNYFPFKKMDGGAVVCRVSGLRKLSQPLVPEMTLASNIIDGHLLNKIAASYNIYPIPAALFIKRVTSLSTHANVHGYTYSHLSYYDPTSAIP